MISEIIKGLLWIGDQDEIRDGKGFGLDIIVCVAREVINQNIDVHIPLSDDGVQGDLDRFNIATNMILSLIQDGKRVLVICKRGHNRSAAVCWRVVKLYFNFDTHDPQALQIMRDSKHHFNVHMFWRQALCNLQEIDKRTGKWWKRK